MSRLIRSPLFQEKLNKEFNISYQQAPQVSSPSIETSGLLKKPIRQNKQYSSSPYAPKKTFSLKVIQKGKFKPNFTKLPEELRYFKKNKTTLNSEVGKKIFSAYSILSPNESNIKETPQDKYLELIRKINDQKEKKSRFEVSKAIFSLILEESKDQTGVLRVIKKEYEQFIKDQAKEFEKLKGNLQDIEKMKSLLSVELEQSVQQNNDLKSSLNALHEKYMRISDKFFKIISFDSNELEKTDENWTRLCQENRMYEDALQKVSEDCKYYKSKAKKMMKLLVAIEKKGYPVEDVYNKEVKKQNVLPKYEGDDQPLDDTEHENIVTGKNPRVKKPFGIPDLDFECLEPDIFSSSDQEDDSFTSPGASDD
ncbi:hypothetical protein SteCoe_35167 [Stentor coeruleus]|uniref:Translin-associated factor X-interacting protein 1 N-terminal domain-containing protein n=1 Tax=Stentor coeruleus TaxID=5963 RepID=A0A1R2ASX8_9CILI|nr:hypothetical protein SteCoe_35167 [Stentor coeruleus]